MCVKSGMLFPSSNSVQVEKVDENEVKEVWIKYNRHWHEQFDHWAIQQHQWPRSPQQEPRLWPHPASPKDSLAWSYSQSPPTSPQRTSPLRWAPAPRSSPWSAFPSAPSPAPSPSPPPQPSTQRKHRTPAAAPPPATTSPGWSAPRRRASTGSSPPSRR